ncbi:MAG: cytochrome c-type biogenesis protein CcmH [Oceanospirillaceae bacterium]|nr:cytochrome c-type biogenesis protein CcmH [Oceanospirillaceae bacterium]MBT13515.1 cytochrome c-type biogenesis protein CcmH [Oceanospirillaceae bacterium]|tara:strand:- start:66049 stop:66510 length:462 start_codon:yes stop_codon:yes gene_type:complete
MKKFVLIFCVCLTLPAWAVVEGYKYQFDSQRETDRFNQLAEDLRCPKCQNQNLADSNAPVASDMREKVYEMMQAGKTDEEIVGYMVERYGDFVNYTPPVKSKTLFLWLGPVAVFVIGLLVLAMIRRGQKQALQPLTEEEKERLNALKNKADTK